ncbi:hypothetical protein R1sor_013478 [Riccia sorocarpa]|uniref:Uncharacterized protein n=1 Tax=Riccia sorocarpa TaxID=122646 RepID=A0ABD3HCU9_9MARC
MRLVVFQPLIVTWQDGEDFNTTFGRRNYTSTEFYASFQYQPGSEMKVTGSSNLRETGTADYSKEDAGSRPRSSAGRVVSFLLFVLLVVVLNAGSNGVLAQDTIASAPSPSGAGTILPGLLVPALMALASLLLARD